MTIRSFSFLNPVVVENQERNWRTFDQGSKTVVYTPTLSNSVGTVTIKPAVFQLYGPLVFFSITLIVAPASGWNNNSTLSLPFNISQPISGVPTATATAPVVIGAAGTLLSWAEVATGVVPSVLNLNIAYTNPSAVLNDVVNINGWYVREA